MEKTIDRRQFLRQTTMAGLGATVAGAAFSGCRSVQTSSTPLTPLTTKPLDEVRVGFVGIGNMGSGHVQNLLKTEGARIAAVCDIRPERTEWAKKALAKAGRPEPKVYGRDEKDFVRMCREEDLDLVFNAAPWKWHTPICMAAMKNGKHAASEVNIALTIDDCWRLVETSERTRRHCVMMENCCYDFTEMMVLNMIRKGLFGELIHGECGYLHDLRERKLSPTYYQGQWRLDYSIHQNGNLYPTHGIGPMAWCMDILRGDAFDTLVSVSSKSLGLAEYARAHYPKWAGQSFALGDVNLTVIRTQHGRTILCKHDTSLPRPYSRDFLVQGTKGLVRKYPEELIHIEGRSKGHGWEALSGYAEEFEHPVWKDLKAKAEGAGHGGMDYIEDYRLIQALRKGVAPDIDVYDSVTWSAIIPLSEQSVARGGKPVDFPDFMRGAWKLPRVLAVMEPAK